MKQNLLRFTALTIALSCGAISAFGQSAIIEQARSGSTSVGTNNTDFVFTGFTGTTTGNHSTAPGLVTGYSTSSRIAATGNPGTNGDQVVISPNGGNGTVSNTLTAGTLQVGQTYTVSASFAGSPTAASPTLSLAILIQERLASTPLPEPPAAVFKPGNGYNHWIPIGTVTIGSASPTFTFSYFSGVNGRWNVDSFLFSPAPTPPTAQYWDVGGSLGGTGAWDTTTTNWNPNGNGSGVNQAYVQTNLSDFRGAPGTVTIAGGGITSSGGLEFDVNGYTVTGGPLTLDGTSGPGTNITVLSTNIATINSVISGSAGLCNAGPGTLNLGAVNNFTGTVTLFLGKLQLNPGINQSFSSLAGAGALALGANTLTVGSDNTSTIYSGVMSDGGSASPGALLNTGPGGQSLGGVSTYAGKTTVNQGAISIGADSVLGAAPSSVVTNQLTLTNGGRLDLSAAFTLNANRGITLGAGGGMLSTPGSGTTATISGPISGSGSLTVPSGGLDLKSTNNTFSGGLYLTATPVDSGGNSLCSVRFDAQGSSGTGKIFMSPTTAVNCTLRNFNTATNIIVPNALEVDFYTNTQATTQIYLAGGASGTNVFAITFSGNINGAASVNIGLDTAGGSSNPGGVVNLSGSNSLWTGGATLQAGTLGVGSSNALGTGGLFLVPQGPAGVLLATTPLTGTSALTNSIGINTSVSSLTIGGTNNLELAGPVFLYASSTLTVTNTGSTILSGGISDSTPLSSDSLTVAGPGTLTLSGASTDDGGTFVNSGTLKVNNSTGSGTGTGAVTVSSGGSLGGSGTISGTVDLNGILSPGNSPGKLTTADETWEPGASYTWEINKAGGTAGTDPGWDQVNITGGLNITANPGSQFTISITSLTSGDLPGPVSDFSNTHSYSWSIAHAANGITNFSSSAFILDTTGFANSLGSGTFGITNNATDILLTFTAPSSGTKISTIHVSGTSLTITGSGGTPSGSYRVLGSTNVAAALSTWTQVGASGSFDGSGNFTFNGSITPSNAKQFFVIVSP